MLWHLFVFFSCVHGLHMLQLRSLSFHSCRCLVMMRRFLLRMLHGLLT